MDNAQTDTRPSKRVKLETSQVDNNPGTLRTMAHNDDENVAHVPYFIHSNVLDDAAKEKDVGIISFIDESRSKLRGTLKKRYTDFLVNEILPNGTVVHLRSMKAKNQSAPPRPEVVAPAEEAIADPVEQETPKPETATRENEAREEGEKHAKQQDSEVANKSAASGDSTEVSVVMLTSVRN